MKKRTIGITLLLYAVMLTTTPGCKPIDRTLDVSYTRIDKGRIGFIRPAGSKEVPELQDILKEVNPNLIYMLKLQPDTTNSQLISVCKYVGDTVMPMEIVFIEDIVKHVGSAFGCESKLADFGVFDKGGKRFRYKVVKIEKDCFKNAAAEAGELVESLGEAGASSQSPTDDLCRILYYFMKNDRDSVLYEISITANSRFFFQSDSILQNVAESFKFYK